MQRDDIFLNIEWTGENWTTSVSIPSLRGFGDRLELTAEDREEIGPEGEFKLTIDTVHEARKPPTAGQRAAWKKVTEGGEAIWEEVLDALVAEYQLQRPMRARYWKAIRGTRHLERSLPPVVNRAVMKELVAPVRFGVHAPDSEHGSVDVYVSYVATWWSEGIHVYIRDGLVREVTAQGAMHHLKLPYQDIPHLGTLRRGPKSKA